MANITVDPAAHDFGDLDIGQPAQVTLTVSSSSDASGSHTVSLRDDDGGFSASPSTVSVPPGQTRTIAITFTPTARTTYLASLLATPDGDGEATVIGSLRGTGVVEVLASPETVQDVDGVTFYEVRLDDFASTTFEHANETTVTESLTAFLRLGSFDLNKESTRSLELLNLIPQTGPATNPYGLSSNVEIVERDGVAGTIFADDVRTRPQDVERIGQTDAVFGDNSQPLTTQDDPGHKLTLEQRHRESSRLYSRGGWRDHSDGNRVTTTYGDKVEVIRGNYKLVVMGRQDNVDECIGWEGSGSHVQDYAPGTMPGASFWLEWINDPRYYAPLFGPDGQVSDTDTSQKGVWLLVNTTQNVYEYARYAGNFREERWGDVIETYIGSENPPDNGAFAVDSTQGTGGHEPPFRLEDRNYDLPEEHAASNELRNVALFSEDNIGAVRSNPHIIEKTWAKRIDTVVGTDNCRVEFISDSIHAEKYEESISVSGDFKTDFRAQRFEEKFVADVHIDEFRKAKTIKTTMVARNVFDLFIANHNEVFIGATESLKLGGFIDMTLGLYELNVDIVAARGNYEIALMSDNLAIASKMTDITSATTRNELYLVAGFTKVGTGISTAFHSGAELASTAGVKMQNAIASFFN